MKKILWEKFVKKNLENICDEQVNHQVELKRDLLMVWNMEQNLKEIP